MPHVFPHIKHVHYLLKKMTLKFPTMSCSFKANPNCYTLTPTTDVFCVWFTVTLVNRNIKVATIMVDCI